MLYKKHLKLLKGDGKIKMRKKINYKKLDEDDILEILLENFQDSKKTAFGRGVLLGTIGKDLRFVGVFGKVNDEKIRKCNLEEFDRQNDFNGDHKFLKEHPEFEIKNSNKK